MTRSRTLLINAIAAIATLTAVSASPRALADDEKCFGIAKAGQNACNSNPNQHSCATRSKANNDPSDFVLTPKATCTKLGGKLESIDVKATTTKAN